MTIDVRTAAELGVPACGARFGIGGVCDLPAGHPVPLAPGWEHAEDVNIGRALRPEIPEELAGRRSLICAEAFGQPDEYSPDCCRFPKSCSPFPHPEAIAAGNVTDDDLEPLDGLPPYCRPCGFRHVGGAAAHAYTPPDPVDEELRGVPGAREARLELVNIRRRLVKDGVREADGNGELRSTVAMVEEALIRRPPTA